MFPVGSSPVGGWQYTSSRDKPFKCTYEGCDSAFMNARTLRTHEVDKHGRKKKFIRGSMVDWIDQVMTTAKSVKSAPYMSEVGGTRDMTMVAPPSGESEARAPPCQDEVPRLDTPSYSPLQVEGTDHACGAFKQDRKSPCGEEDSSLWVE